MSPNISLLQMLFGIAVGGSKLVCASTYRWDPASHKEFRGPCPMLNTLANHHFLPHDGRNLTREVVVNALKEALNFEESLSNTMFDHALIANPNTGATSFDLDQLNQHNVLEHDASMSRTDAYFGNNHAFNRTVFDATKSYWTSENLTLPMLANSMLMQRVQSRAFNPDYTFTETMNIFTIGETVGPTLVFGDLQTGTVLRSLVVYFIENERLPISLGWTKKDNPLTLTDVLGMSARLVAASEVTTPRDQSGLVPEREVSEFSEIADPDTELQNQVVLSAGSIEQN